MAIFTSPFHRAIDANGLPLPGATLNFYESGTLTPLAVYSDDELTTSLGAVVTADAGGFFPPGIYTGPDEYRVILKDALGNTIGDVDPLSKDDDGRNVDTLADLDAAPTAAGNITNVLSYDGGEFITYAVANLDAVQTAEMAADTAAALYRPVTGNPALVNIRRQFLADGILRPQYFNIRGNGLDSTASFVRAQLQKMLNFQGVGVELTRAIAGATKMEAPRPIDLGNKVYDIDNVLFFYGGTLFGYGALIINENDVNSNGLPDVANSCLAVGFAHPRYDTPHLNIITRHTGADVTKDDMTLTLTSAANASYYADRIGKIATIYSADYAIFSNGTYNYEHHRMRRIVAVNSTTGVITFDKPMGVDIADPWIGVYEGITETPSTLGIAEDTEIYTADRPVVYGISLYSKYGNCTHYGSMYEADLRFPQMRGARCLYMNGVHGTVWIGHAISSGRLVELAHHSGECTVVIDNATHEENDIARAEGPLAVHNFRNTGQIKVGEATRDFNIHIKNWNLTGAVSNYHSILHLQDCQNGSIRLDNVIHSQWGEATDPAILTERPAVVLIENFTAVGADVNGDSVKETGPAPTAETKNIHIHIGSFESDEAPTYYIQMTNAGRLSDIYFHSGHFKGPNPLTQGIRLASFSSAGAVTTGGTNINVADEVKVPGKLFVGAGITTGFVEPFCSLGLDSTSSIANDLRVRMTSVLSGEGNTLSQSAEVRRTRAAWATATAYAVGDRVLSDGNQYRAVTAHTSGARFAKWVTGVAYAVGDLVAVDRNIYRALTAHTGAATFAEDLAAARWVLDATFWARDEVANYTFPANTMNNRDKQTARLEYVTTGTTGTKHVEIAINGAIAYTIDIPASPAQTGTIELNALKVSNTSMSLTGHIAGTAVRGSATAVVADMSTNDTEIEIRAYTANVADSIAVYQCDGRFRGRGHA